MVMEEEATARGGSQVEGVEWVATTMVEAEQGEAMAVRM